MIANRNNRIKLSSFVSSIKRCREKLSRPSRGCIFECTRAKQVFYLLFIYFTNSKVFDKESFILRTP